MHHSETSLRLDPPSAGRGGAEAVRAATAPLPSGWICLRDSNISGLLGQPVQIQYVLLHPDVGIALLDIAPTVTPDAEAILRQRLATVRFEAIFQGYLPIIYRSIRPGDVSAIDAILSEAFAALPPLTLAGGDAWVTVLQRALSPRNPARAAAPAAPPVPRPAVQAPPPQAEPQADPSAAAPTPAETMPPHTAEPEDMPQPADAAEDAAASPLPWRPQRPGIWLAAGLGAAIGISALAAVMSGSDRPPANAGEAPAAAAVPRLADPPPGRPGMGAVDGAGPAMPRVAGIPPDPGTPLRSKGAPAPVQSPPLAAAAPLPSPPAMPAPARGGAVDAPPPPVRPALRNEESLPQVTVKSPANLRKGPGNSYPVLRVTRRGETFRVHAHALGGWVEVGDDQPQGWIHSSLLTGPTP